MGLDDDGFLTLPYAAQVAQWAAAARNVMVQRLRDKAVRDAQLRHRGTWFVGVDALPNDASGAVAGVALHAPWRQMLPDLPMHRAQVSIVYPGYPKQDADESDANHRFRRDRRAAHVDGLLPVGMAKRRYAAEHHAYILSLPLNAVTQAPTVVWRGSHRIMQAALQDAIGTRDPRQVDVTQAYQAARRQVFETCEEVALTPGVGQAALIHRFALHGTAPWEGATKPGTDEGRMIAFFRPETTAQDWLYGDPLA